MESSPTLPIANQSQEKKKKKKKRCNHPDCKKKLSLTDYSCKCGKIYCTKHRLVFNHSCSFDWKKSHQTNLNKVLSDGKSDDTKNFVSM